MTLTVARSLHNFRVFLLAAVAVATAAFPPDVRAQDLAGPPALLDVPYLPQSEALCGAAAIAMLMRYWGATGVYAETFADLVDPEAQGIRGRDLIRTLEAKEYDAVSLQGDLDQVRRALSGGNPAIALIEDRPRRFHYVVIVGLRNDRVVIHDPARAPYQVIDSDAFLKAWTPSGRWMLVARPRTTALPPASPPASEVAAVGSSGRGVCAGLIDEGVRLSGRGDLRPAEDLLELAAIECPRDPAPWRELAGLHALRGEWREAAVAAKEALERDPHDQHATRTLATSLFLTEDREPALDVWNRIQVPLVDLVDVRGLEQTRYAVVAAAVDLAPQTLLTRGRLERARQRLQAFPSLAGSRVTYEPDENDRAKVVAAVIERPLVPSGLVPLAAVAARTVTDRELRVNISSPSGGGELWTGAWRWWENRPRIDVGLAAPSPFGGVWSVSGFAERQTYGDNDSPLSERRRGVALNASDWLTGSLRLLGGVAFDRWTSGFTTSVTAGAARSFDNGRGTVALDGTVVMGAFRTELLAAKADWQSTLDRAGFVWHARGGITTAGRRAPFALWPGAGVGQGRDVLLRAHSLLHDGVIRGVFGRRLSYGGLESRYWRWTAARALRIAPAAFVDIARADEVPRFGDNRTHVDVGGGVRIAMPGAGVLRVDWGHGLRDGRNAVSLGWTR